MACFKAHKDKLRQKFRVDPTHLVEVAEGLGQMWVDTLRNEKLTPEDLRATLLDFGKTAKFLRERRPGLHDQLVDTAHRTFKTMHLPGNRTARFEDYEH